MGIKMGQWLSNMSLDHNANGIIVYKNITKVPLRAQFSICV